MRDLNLSSPREILNILGQTFETARSNKDISSLRKCLDASVKVDLTPFSSEEVSTFHYFVSNGWSYMLVLTHKNPEDIPCDSHFYEKEIYHLRCALTHSSLKKDTHVCEILTNLGCALSHVGRYAEAQEYFNRALAVNSEFGMALGNKGYGLYRYARVMYDGVHLKMFVVVLEIWLIIYLRYIRWMSWKTSGNTITLLLLYPMMKLIIGLGV